MLISPSPSDVAPTVGARQVGNEHSQPARFAIWSLVFSVKSSLLFFATGWILKGTVEKSVCNVPQKFRFRYHVAEVHIAEPEKLKR